MEALVNSFLLVFVGEMGDKTQLLSLVLTVRYKKPWTILAGVFVATILNHAAASWTGGFVASYFTPETLKWMLAFIFFTFAGWILIPDKEEDLDSTKKNNVFIATLTAFFFAEMGDKTQLATVALGARYSNAVIVTIGTTLGMLTSNAIAIFLGEKLLKQVPMNWVRALACLLFVAFGIAIIVRF